MESSLDFGLSRSELVLPRFVPHQYDRYLTCLTQSNSGNYLLTASQDDTTIKLWSISNVIQQENKLEGFSKPIGEFHNDTITPINDLSFNPYHNSTFACCSKDLTIFDVQSSTIINRYSATSDRDQFNQAKYLNENLILGCCNDMIEVYDLRQQYTKSGGYKVKSLGSFQDHTDDITSICISDVNRHQFVSAGKDGRINQYDLRNSKCITLDMEYIYDEYGKGGITQLESSKLKNDDGVIFAKFFGVGRVVGINFKKVGNEIVEQVDGFGGPNISYRTDFQLIEQNGNGLCIIVGDDFENGVFRASVLPGDADAVTGESTARDSLSGGGGGAWYSANFARHTASTTEYSTEEERFISKISYSEGNKTGVLASSNGECFIFSYSDLE
ncbi:hypothetical protein CANARDRAFT_20674 [[Candida] arabinofermentans NRRL YB-2248]|uniref:Anaphase-promoting complex subunit 4 WD40 domain-containing protein n=1 Tax=[Candida] arabinofermentans NRRL YB-2248 TaxID=983967 RepID=A0A1E4T856_9ASCO|nr:hypothetical protein CANARDRAFT_20674 [[Candida] arabinofermentans NRRL YB-2248]